MIILVVILFALTLYFSQNQSRVQTKISYSRRNWSYILASVAVLQLLLCIYGNQHLFIGVFVGIWARFTYTARKSASSWKGACKTILLVLSSFVYLASVNGPMLWEPVAIQATILIVMIVLQRNLGRLSTSNVPDMDETNEHKGNSSQKSNRLFFNVSKRTKRIIYWIAGVIIFIIVLPFIIFFVDKIIDGYMHYFYSVQQIGKVEEVDSICVVEDDIPTSDIIYLHSDGTKEVYPIDEYYNIPDSSAE